MTEPSKPTGIYVISPSGAVPADDRAANAQRNLAQAGFKVKLDRTALRRVQRFAGTDAQRAAAFERAAAQAAPIVMISRGGYGMTRLLNLLDYRRLADAGKHWVGLSDFTAFHLAMLARTGTVTWAGPSLLEDFGAARFEDVDDVTLDTFREAMTGQLEILGFACKGPSGIDERGVLWGGNLALVCTLAGTPYGPKVKGGILYLEDIGEHPYRVERMLTQLLHSGILDRQKAIVFGHFNHYQLTDHDAGFDMPAVVKWLRTQTSTPIVTGLPFGHAKPKLTLPHGAKVGIATEGRTCYLVLPHAH